MHSSMNPLALQQEVPMSQTEIEIFYPKDQAMWRNWLAQNHQSKSSVWIVFYNKASQMPTLSWSEAVDVALCFGWIDSKKVKVDEHSSHQFFSPRKKQSTWSKVNKEKVQQLIAKGLMTQAGLDSIAIAKENGSWNLLDQVEELLIPDDLNLALRATPPAEEYFLSLSKSVKKMMLTWLVLAKRPETRQNRISEIARTAAQGTRPKQFLL